MAPAIVKNMEYFLFADIVHVTIPLLSESETSLMSACDIPWRA